MLNIWRVLPAVIKCRIYHEEFSLLHVNFLWLILMKCSVNSVVTFQCNDFACRIHDGRISRDRSAYGVSCVIHINDDHLGCIAHFLSDTNEFVRLHGKGAEPNVCSIDSNILELQTQIKKENLLYVHTHRRMGRGMWQTGGLKIHLLRLF